MATETLKVIWIEAGVHAQMKSVAAQLGISLQRACTQALERYVLELAPALHQEELDRLAQQEVRRKAGLPVIAAEDQETAEERERKRKKQEQYEAECKEGQKRWGFDKYIGWKPPKSDTRQP